MKMQVYQRNYLEYNLDNIIEMGPEQFDIILSAEVYNLILIYRLLDLMDYFKESEEYIFCHVIQSWFDEHNIHLD